MIKKFHQFIKEEVSGTELVGNVSMGPGYGDVSLKNNTISKKHTSAEYSNGLNNPDSNNPLTNNIFFDDQYSDVYNRYLKNGGSHSELTNDRGFNMKIMVDFLRDTES